MFFGLRSSCMLRVVAILLPSVIGCVSPLTESQTRAAGSEPKILQDRIELIPSVSTTVTKIQFFESGRSDLELRKQRVYQNRFAQATTRTIYTEIHLAHPEVRRRTDFPITLVFTRANGTTFRIEEYRGRVEEDWPLSEHWIGVGHHSPGNWEPGIYQVDVFINGKKVANGSFEIYATTAKNRPLRWASENPLALSAGSRKAEERVSQGPSREAGIGSGSDSLDQLRRGESPATPLSSPLRDVNFAFDRHDLDQAAREALQANAGWLKSNPSAQVQIEGHCDERGTNEYNLALGARRAAASKDYVVSLGISADRLSTTSYGEEIPVCKEATEECWAKNRRARFIILQASPGRQS